MYKIGIKYLSLIFIAVTLSSYLALPPQVINARRLVAGIKPADNSYRLMHRIVLWKNPDGSGRYVCHSDCVGFIDSLLMYSYGLRLSQFRQIVGKERPTARFMEECISQGRGFETIPLLQDAVPGDIIGVAFPLGSKANGHVMMIDDYPQRRKSTPPLIADTIQWAVRIIDCTGEGHGRADTRYIGLKNGRAQFTDGVGCGTIRLYTDFDGRIVGYAWSVSRRSDFKSCTTHPMTVGRFRGF